MNIRTSTIIAALAIAASGGSALAADQKAFFEQQREITDGYYPQYNVVPTPARQKPDTVVQRAETDWLNQERINDSNGSRPVLYPTPADAAAIAALKNQAAPQAAIGD